MKQTAFRQEGGKHQSSSTVRRAFAALALPVLLSGNIGCATTEPIKAATVNGDAPDEDIRRKELIAKLKAIKPGEKIDCKLEREWKEELVREGFNIDVKIPLTDQCSH